MLALLAALPSIAPAQVPVEPSAVTPPPPPLPAPGAERSFPTPAGIADRELTLGETIQLGLDNAPKIAAAVGDYAAARQRVNEVLAALLPQLSGQWSSFETRNNALALNNIGSVTATQLLFDFGKTWAATDAARSTAESFRQAVEVQSQSISLNVKTSYFTLLLAKRLVQVNVAALDRALLNLKSAKGFYAVGTQPKSAVTRAEVDVANGRVSVIQAQNALALARVALNTAMGISISAPTEVVDILAYEPHPVNRDALLPEALARRPDYLQVKAVANSTEAIVRQRFRGLFPSVTGAATFDATVGNSTPSQNTSYGAQLTWSIFDGGNAIAQFAEARAGVDAARARVRDTELTVQQDVQQSYLILIANEQQIGAARKAVESAQQNFDLVQGRFDAGIAKIIDLTDAQLALTQAQSAEVQALANYKIAIAQLQHAIGLR